MALTDFRSFQSAYLSVISLPYLHPRRQIRSGGLLLFINLILCLYDL